MRPKILVVDDELFVRELLEEYLTRSGYDVVTAAEPHEAIRKMQIDEYDSVLVDLRIGHGGGFDLVQNIRHISPDSTVIPMTGYPSVETAREAIRCGAFDYIVKPFKLKELEKTVSEAVAECRRRYEARQLKERLTELEARIAAMNVRESKQRLTLKRGHEVVSGSLENGSGVEPEAESLGARLTRIRRQHSLPTE